MPETKVKNLYPFQRLNWYPHMKPYDYRIWERFIIAFPDMYEWCEYDVAVGPGPNFDPRVNDESGGDIYKLYQRKIDVVGHIKGEIDIIEVKPKAGPSAIGQVRFYKKLYLEDIKPAKEPKCIIVTDELVAGMAEYAAAEGVQLVIV